MSPQNLYLSYKWQSCAYGSFHTITVFLKKSEEFLRNFYFFNCFEETIFL